RALHAMKESRPGCSVRILTSSLGAAGGPLLEPVDETIVYDPPWMKATPQREGPDPDVAVLDRLRQGRFDGAVIFTVYSQNPLASALLCHLAGIPRRLAHCRENPYQLLTDWIAEPEPQRLIRHEARRQLDLVGWIGCGTSDERLRIRVPEPAVARAKEALREWGAVEPGRDEWILIHPGASAPSRRWPPERFAEAADRIHAETSLPILFSGTSGEAALVEQIAARMKAPSRSMAGKLSLAEFAAVVRASRLLISNNTSPVHIASAVGTPVIDLYALTNPQHTPWMVPNRVLYHDVACRWCYKSLCPQGHHDCLRKVEPESVVRAAHELLAETRAAGYGISPVQDAGPHDPRAEEVTR
ncbi:MAG: glycosyltransferase family 9 protein, partial [Candidatus Eisenbacteria bacterium]|nr:glycosyltransferase family 9 protein [Candidatus Eisenbacteria bacterium]